MGPIYQKKYEIEDIHLDCFGRVKPSVLLYFAQEAAGMHCLELGTDGDTLSKKNLFWAVIRQRVQITRLPEAGDIITVETWPMPTTRVAYPRSTVAYDEKGNEVFRAIALWVLMDAGSRAMILPGKGGIEVAGTVRGTELSIPGSLVLQRLENSTSRRVGYTELDRNGHMNNTRYLDWICDLLPSGFYGTHPIREFTICYLNEAKEGQLLEMNWQLEEGPVLQVDAHRARTDVPEQQERVFTAQLLF